MDMTFNEYTSKMFSILETAIYNYEINTLVEAADGEEEVPEKKESRFAALKAVAKKVWTTVWSAIKTFISNLVAKVNDLVNSPVTIEEDMKLYPGATKFDGTLMRYANELASGKIDNVDEAIKYLDTSVNMTDIVKAGSTINTRGIGATYKKYLAAIEKLEAVTFNGDSDALKTAQTALKRIINVLYSYAIQADKLITARTKQVIANKEAKAASKAAKEQEKINKSKVTNESVEADDIALSARLILEAANLLNEEAEVEGNEYPADDITGGEGEKIDQEEIKELLDGDAEAIAILNDDEGGKAITESVVIHF